MMKDKQIEKLKELVAKIKLFWDISVITSIRELESEISALDSQIEEGKAVTDEEIFTEADNYAKLAINQQDIGSKENISLDFARGARWGIGLFQSRLSEPSMPENTTTINLCESCMHCIADCNAKNPMFGDGKGNDNVYNCDAYEYHGEPSMPERKELIKFLKYYMIHNSYMMIVNPENEVDEYLSKQSEK